MTARTLVLGISLWLAIHADAGVTIHFAGAVNSVADVPTVLKLATDFAREQGWKVEDASAAHGKLARGLDDKSRDYDGRVTGIVIFPPGLCEPVWLQFGDDLQLQDFVKTQFAGADVHMAIVRLFDLLKPALKSLTVEDEGEFWEKRDRVVLEKNLTQVTESLRQMKREEPAMYGPIRLKSGRVVDLIR